MDLSKVFHTLNHNLLLAEINASYFSFYVIKFILSYLSERFQRVNINSSFNEWCKILVPQGSILGPLLFNILVNDIFCFIQDVCNFVDDNSLYSIGDNFKEVKTILKKNFETLQGWFYENHMVLNSTKCHYLIINKDIANKYFEVGKESLYAETELKLLRIVIDKDLNFQAIQSRLPKRPIKSYVPLSVWRR